MKMMTNLFSMFDPSSSYCSMLWAIMILPLMLTTLNTYSNSNKSSLVMNKLSMFIKKEDKKYSKMLMNKTFLMIMSMNMVSLIPYNFTTMAHLNITFSLSLTLWLSIIMFGYYISFKSMVSHMTPMGTPMSLMNFMVLIEMISNMIRPITLSIRLSANMVAGHLIMALLSNLSIKTMWYSFLVMPMMMIITLLEMMVAITQAYVFTTLMVLYHNEIK